ncbi:piggyBac transposable element-derived protein 3-like [Watersipora subatra]|uniref:piggyBac transposable element-derived protein 3-like n=1 Tax=Watersipora subatra TaxID=2589382 RepID=UPI00355C1EF1
MAASCADPCASTSSGLPRKRPSGNLTDIDAIDVLERLDDSDLDFCSDDSDADVDYDPSSASLLNHFEESDDDVEPPPSKMSKKSSKKTCSFRKSDSFASKFKVLHQTAEMDDCESPVEAISKFFSKKIFESMADLTNRYHTQHSGKSLKVTPAEIKTFFGISLVIGCIGMKRLRMYWEKKTKVPIVANAMTRNRFFKIRNNLKVVDTALISEEAKKEDRLWKVTPLVEHIRNICTELPRENFLSIDEQMISFTGRCPARQYVPRKPNPTGLKNFVLAGSSGLVYDFEIYRGEGTFAKFKLKDGSGGQGVGAVLRLTKYLGPGKHVFCDRFFTTIPLIEHLAKQSISLTGTISAKYVPVQFSSDKVMKSKGRGTMEQFVTVSRGNEPISIVKWFDTKSILMASSLHGLHPVEDCKRWCKQKKQFITVPRPAVVQKYNLSMGGVDLCDQAISYHRVTARSKRWPIRVINHLLDLAVNNCWLTQRQSNSSNKLMQLFDYRFIMGEQIIASAAKEADSDYLTDDELQTTRKIVPLPMAYNREKGAKHLPEAVKLNNSARCRREGCSNKTSIRCTKCNVFLCINASRNCFMLFHKSTC